MSSIAACMSARVADSVIRARPAIVKGLYSQGWAEIPRFFGSADNTVDFSDLKSIDVFTDLSTSSQRDTTCTHLRREAVEYYRNGRFRLSKSSRWSPDSDEIEYFDKTNVWSLNLKGVDHNPEESQGPYLESYVRCIAKEITQLVISCFPRAQLQAVSSSKEARAAPIPLNKLAVCTGHDGKGANYEAHYDSGPNDLRKVTVLLYLNPAWRPESGGQFRIHNPPVPTAPTPSRTGPSQMGPTSHPKLLIEPIADTLLVFWSDKVIHSVLPNTVLNELDHRYAITVWLETENYAAVAKDADDIQKYF